MSFGEYCVNYPTIIFLMKVKVHSRYTVDAQYSQFLHWVLLLYTHPSKENLVFPKIEYPSPVLPQNLNSE